ncbi:DEAD-box helicase superfamily protein [Emydomyces testavorans]|uniref:DEAD-box helicase superfamily protein n=1 Tax=Emydomyces testavorans TaxID=2070801 RepID=A0AAF0IKA0_9EURO|nr:DEAD-box helicase superfamily protein [Emydomyces testavorans]
MKAIDSDYRDIVKGPATSDHYRSKYALARQVLILHLQRNLQKKYPDISVCQFQSISSPDFRHYLQTNNAYFVMCHNGALTKATKPLNACLAMIRRILSLGLDVAVINEIEWRDNKIITRVLRAGSSSLNSTEDHVGRGISSAKIPVFIQSLNNVAQIQKREPDLQLTIRDQIVLAVISELMIEKRDTLPQSFPRAMLLHLACLATLALTERRLPVFETSFNEEYNSSLDEFCKHAEVALCEAATQHLSEQWETFNLYDLIDGRILRFCIWLIERGQLSQFNADTLKRYNLLVECLGTMSKVSVEASCVPFTPVAGARVDSATVREGHAQKRYLLPFEHPIFDRHLACIHVAVKALENEDPPTRGIQDRTHWHNRRLLDSKNTSSKQSFTKWRNPTRRNQLQMRNMTKYAESLTNAKGNILSPEIIISQGTNRKAQSKSSNKKKQSSKVSEITKKNEQERLKKDETSCRGSWERTLNKLRSVEQSAKVQWCVDFLARLDEKKREHLEAEIRLYLLKLLISHRQTRDKTENTDLLRLDRDIWEQVRILRKSHERMTPACYRALRDICPKLGLPEFPEQLSFRSDYPLSFALDPIQQQSLGGSLGLREFQLLYCGPHMDRQTGSTPDSRVTFKPDAWQREVLDALDAEHSIFVVAPTSAGKTFISFYAMSKILRGGDDDVLVYVAPTKALVNQIAAEIHARFTKTYSKPEQTVWAIHTRDIRVNNPMNCQILVTVPHVLQIVGCPPKMLLAPTNATTWAPRVKCIIFDEIHSIGQTDDGLVWEQLLLLAPCRIIGLSATVGNPDEFTQWLSLTQKNLGIPLRLITHNQRYSDLRKFIHSPPNSFSFRGLCRPRREKAMLAHENISGLQYIHPIATLLNRQREMPDDLTLEPRDCYFLWKAMVKHASDRFPVPAELHPHRALPSFIQRSDVFQWEAKLKRIFSNWMADDESPFELVRIELGQGVSSSSATNNLNKESDGYANTAEAIEHGTRQTNMETMCKKKLCTSVFPLLVSLHEQNLLPALLFNFERTTCERIAITALQQLQKAEDEYRGGPTWKQKIGDYEQYCAAASKRARAAESSKKADKRKGKSTEENDPDVAPPESHPFDTFYPERPIEQFSFANPYKLPWKELLEEIKEMKIHHVNPLLLEALKRGIGVHHAGLNRRYRHWYVHHIQYMSLSHHPGFSVERLFRGGFLRVVVATGTLALGINMPCSTVIFCGDSVYLTALGFRQAAGRAGRRGFDLLGNVIFHGIPRHKVLQLISSRLPDLQGHFPITTSLVLRLFILLHNSKESAYAIRAIDALLTRPLLFAGGAESREKVLHHLRFSIEYLRRQHLLGRHGEPIELACAIAHLYYTERSAFAFHALLRGGYFQQLCEKYRGNEATKLRTLMIVLAHLFGRKSLGHRYEEILKQKEQMKSPSAVLLPDLPEEAMSMLRRHNQEILETYTAYVDTFVNQHLPEAESELPLTGMPAGGKGNPQLSRLLGALEPSRCRSAFVGLSGHDDQFESISDLCHTVRSGVFLENSAVPYLDIYPDEGMAPLNAYLYDFFCHGSQEPLEVANRISRSDSWFLLNDFSLILATIIVALENYLDPDMDELSGLLDTGGEGDLMSLDDENDAEESENEAGVVKPMSTSTLANTSKNQKSAIKDEDDDNESIPEAWDDGDSEPDRNNNDNPVHRDTRATSNKQTKQNSPISLEVLQLFRALKAEFDEKFHAIFA